MKSRLNIILSLFSALGVLGLVGIIIITRKPSPIAQPVSPPATSPYKKAIAGSGIIESKTTNIEPSALVGGIIEKIYVDVGARVKKGDPLFALDQQMAQAEIVVKQAQVKQAQAALKQAEATVKSSKDRLNIAMKLHVHKVISEDDFLTRKNTHLIDLASYASAQEALRVVQSELKQAQVNLDVRTVRAPVDCDVLQANLNTGEYASPGAKGLMVLGETQKLNIRVDIDENEAWRFKKGAKAIAYIRGNRDIKLDLTFVRLELFVIPKVSLTGSPTERVDTRVLQPIYEFDPHTIQDGIYVGQQVDVFIESQS
jgi:HlyD family secretion protein